MNKTEIQETKSFLNDCLEARCEGDPPLMQAQLMELYALIEKLMNEQFKATDKTEKMAIALLELEARKHKAEFEQRLAICN